MGADGLAARDGDGAAYCVEGAAGFSPRAPLIAGSGAPTGRAVVDGDGYRLSGRWRYGSGLLTRVRPQRRVVHKAIARMSRAAAPRGDHADHPVSSDSTAAGMTSSGCARPPASTTRERRLDPRELDTPAYRRRPIQGGELYRLGVFGMVTLVHSAWALGVGRRALDALAALARVPRPGNAAIGMRWIRHPESTSRPPREAAAARTFCSVAGE